MHRSYFKWKVTRPLLFVAILICATSCSGSPGVKTGDAVVARTEIGALESQLVSEERYRITEDDLSSLRESGLLDEKSEVALKELQNNPNQ